MDRIVLLHWNAAEAPERTETLRRAGYRVEWRPARGPADLRALKESPPGALIIDLNYLPSQGRALGVWLRRQKSTRAVPLVFIEGDPEKTRRVRGLLPDASYTSWGRVSGTLRKALRRPVSAPVVPGTMDDYSGTPLPQKLGLRPGLIVALLRAPAGFERTLGALPENLRLRRQARGLADRILFFTRSKAELARHFTSAEKILTEGGRLWILWPKKSSGMVTDFGQNEVRATGLGMGWVDYKISAIDPTWSGLCFARRGRRSPRE